jgi:hypothetical protein
MLNEKSICNLYARPIKPTRELIVTNFFFAKPPKGVVVANPFTIVPSNFNNSVFVIIN